MWCKRITSCFFKTKNTGHTYFLPMKTLVLDGRVPPSHNNQQEFCISNADHGCVKTTLIATRKCHYQMNQDGKEQGGTSNKWKIRSKECYYQLTLLMHIWEEWDTSPLSYWNASNNRGDLSRGLSTAADVVLWWQSMLTILGSSCGW